ncbi:MAG: glycosyltransferase family 2 protein [Alphaproteobacteria bacterium]|nr:glycosyltransferase family 2 protein [Alphaproteobacteria bacterium]MBP7729019.1 glycosyltransferase family 2 protein [Alphaproteobacteria bacterium]
MMYKICALIPTHNHHRALPGMRSALKAAGLDVFIVDDGSSQETQKALDQLSYKDSGVHLLRLPVNKGKGAAMQAGFRWVAELGYTHAFQIDADGQHSLVNIQNFLTLSKRNPQVLLSGQPLYDASIPFSRWLGRWLTHVWVWIETLSFRITDSMCGFRIYPLQKTLSVLDRISIGCRMDFDTDLMVRLFWQGTPVIMIPVKVIYPEGNSSNFDVFWDNWRITKMHTRLVLSMIMNLPAVLFKRPNYKDLDLPEKEISWVSLKERGSLIGLFLVTLCYRFLGRRVCLVIGVPLVLYYYLTGTHQRQASQVFLKRAFSCNNSNKNPRFIDRFRHFMNFLEMALDKFAAWSGRLDLTQIEKEGIENLTKIMASEKGGMLLVSHLGNMEFCRAVSSSAHKCRLHVLLHTKNAKRFNKILKFFNPLANINIIEVTDTGPDTILYLKSRIEAGDWVVIAADRVPVVGHKRVSYVPFLGAEAPFSQGPYILAALLECPVYTAIAVREGQKFRVFIDHFSDKVILERKEREEKLRYFSKKYAENLEYYCLRYPYQWFNFFDFWKKIT